MKDLKRLSTTNNDFLCYLVRDPSLTLRMTKHLSDLALRMTKPLSDLVHQEDNRLVCLVKKQYLFVILRPNTPGKKGAHIV